MDIKSASHLETKSVSPYVQEMLFGQNLSGNDFRLTPNQAYWLWEKSDSIGDATDRIAWAFEQMTPILTEKKTKKNITDHDLLELLSNPGPMQSGSSFFYELMVSFLLTGECYPVVLGNTRFPPTALYSVKANHSNLVEKNGWLDSIIFSANYDQGNYKQQIIKGRNMWVYQKADKLSETIQIYIQRQKTGLRAQSVLQRIYYQAVTKYYGNIHNSSIVKRGDRPGGLFSPDSKMSMSQDQYESFKKEIKTNVSGPNNAGKSIVSPVPVKYENFLLNTRDMDFAKLIDESRIDVYNQFHVPLPLVIPETMTMNNYQKATEALYDFAVLPPAKFIFNMIGKFLLPRYKNSENLILGINEKELPALKQRLFIRGESMRKVASYREDEIRAETGYESLGPEGKEVWKPSTLVPSSEDDDYTDDINSNTGEEELEEDE